VTDQNHRHDRGYKRLFSNPEMVRQLLTGFVDEDWVHHIDYSTLEKLDKSFINEAFARREADIIYKVKLQDSEAYIFILMEFQSTIDRFMALRMLHYICEFYEYLLDLNKVKKLPPVFPLVLYNGDRRWTAPFNISTLIETSGFQEHIPSFSYYCIAENQIEETYLKELNNAVAALFYVEKSDPESLKRELTTVRKLLEAEQKEVLTVFINWLHSIFTGGNNEYTECIEEIRSLQEEENMLASSMKKYEEKLIQQGKLEGQKEGVQQGLEQGLEKGRKEGLNTARCVLLKYLDSRFEVSPENKSRVLHCNDLTALKEALEVFITATSIEEVLRLLP
jgi:predicted transposase/invertase (TIGR01784 family)